MRTCCRCKRSLPESEYWRVKKGEDEQQVSCKDCMRVATKTWGEKNLRKKRERNRLSSRQRIRNTADRSPEQLERDRAYSRNYYHEHKNEYRAREAVRQALLRGEKLLAGTMMRFRGHERLLFRPVICEVCGRMETLAPHHYLGYDPKYWLDVKFVCAGCHSGIHVEVNYIKTVEPGIANPFLEGFRRYCADRANRENNHD